MILLENCEALERAQRAEDAKAITFKEVAEQYIEKETPGWKSPKSPKQWRATLEKYAYPVFGNISVGAVDTPLVKKVLLPIWLTINETARRVRIENILDFAKVSEYREGENPARWKGHLEKLLPKYAGCVKHFAALPFTEVGAFMQALKAMPGNGALALQFTILTAMRTDAARRAQWKEINFAEKLWTVPGDRMKGKKGQEKPHRVPLSPAALDVLRKVKEAKDVDEVFIFPSPYKSKGKSKPLSNMAMLKTLERMGRRYEITVHGFRSAFRDWAEECTTHSHNVIEMALAHTITNAVEAAYRRGDLLEKRRPLMNDWADFCAKLPGESDNVVRSERGHRRPRLRRAITTRC